MRLASVSCAGTAVQTGVAFVTMTLAVVVFSNVAQTLVTRLGARGVLTAGMLTQAAGLALYNSQSLLRPHTDLALVLGMLSHVITEGLHDKGFVEKWVDGFGELADHFFSMPAAGGCL